MSLTQHLHRGIWIFGCIVGSASSVAYAQQAADTTSELNETTRRQAEQAFWKGKEHYDAGEFEQARDQFQSAYSLVKDPYLLYNIAQACRKLGDCRQALETYERFLRDAPESPLAPQAEKQVAELQVSCLPQVSAANPSDPTIAAPSEPPPLAPTAPVGNSLASGFESGHSQAPRVKSAHDSLPWVVTTLAAGVAAGGTAIGLTIWNHGRYGQWTDTNRSLRQGLAPGETVSQWQVRQQRNNDLIVTIQSMDKKVVVLGIGAGALLTTSAILHYFWRDSESNSISDSKHVSALELPWVSIGPTSASIALQGTFF